MGILRSSKYRATQVRSTISLEAQEAEGILLEVTPNPENNGPESMAAVYEDLADPETAPVNSFEIWYHQGQIRFYFYAANESMADTIRRAITNNYPDSVVDVVRGRDPAWPTITPEESVSTCYFTRQHPTENVDYLPIAYQNDGRGWRPEQHPIAEIIDAMQGGKETTTILQVTVQPMPHSWANEGTFFRQSAPSVKEDYKERGDTEYATMVDKKSEQAMFATNLRLLAAAPQGKQALSRVSSVAGMIERKLKSRRCGMALKAASVGGLTPGRRRSNITGQIKRMRDRKIQDFTASLLNNEATLILGDEELANFMIPMKEAGAPGINWKHSSSGAQAPVDRPEHQELTEDDIDEDRLPPMGSTLEGRDPETDGEA